MKRIYCLNTILIFLFIFTVGTNSVTAKTLYDDFSGDYLDSAKWEEQDFVREVKQGELLLKVGNSATELSARNTSPFIDPSSINIIECDISVVIANLDSGDESESSARVTGRFYNTQNSGTERGDIWVALKIGDRGSGLETWWEAWEATDDVGDNWDEK